MDRQGQLESALLIRQADGTHKLVFGNRRLAAARKNHWEKLKVDIKENVSESERLQMILSENGEREDASPFYTAMLYSKLMAAENLKTPGELAEKVGKDRSVIARYLSVNAIPKEVQESVHRCTLGLRHWLEIAKLTQVEDQLNVLKECATQGLAGKALEKRVNQLLNPKPADAEGTAKPAAEAQPFQFT